MNKGLIEWLKTHKKVLNCIYGMKNKTLTGLEALDNIRECGEWLPLFEVIIIQKQLIALKIIKEKDVEISWFKYTNSLEEYNEWGIPSYKQLTQEEYDLLKEVLV